ncbi:MAG: hypothetical protein KIH08_17360, partial [Candidatus Freyarchaeota archaeon]|nr:hypothetical protein [Candidatus Jordarchaeia archaeon]
KKVVWIFLDGSSSMAIGTSVENAFEYAVQAVSSLAQFYLARNCYVGFCVYNSGRLLLPDVGRKQEYRITKEILDLDVSTTNEPLKKAVKKCRGYLLGMNPYSIIITIVRKENLKELVDGIKELRKYTVGYISSPIIILHIMGHSIVAQDFYEYVGAKLLEMKNQPAIRALRRAGAFVIPWDPRRQSLTTLMFLGMKGR